MGLFRWKRVIAAIALPTVAAATWAIAPTAARAADDCEPPNAGEFLLLVRQGDRSTEARFYDALPEGVVVESCDYVGEAVWRLSGFPSRPIADAWVAYLRERTGLEAYPIESPIAQGRFDPQPLGGGYAVLVDYFDDLDAAIAIADFAQDPVGVASYAQRPYLLVGAPLDANGAAAIVRQLSDRGFAAMSVDARQVVVLTPQIRQ